MKWKYIWFSICRFFGDWKKELKEEHSSFFSTTKGKVSIVVFLLFLVVMAIVIVKVQAYFEIRGYRHQAQMAMDAKIYPIALENFEKLAATGDHEAMIQVAEMYFDGIGTAQNPNKAIEYLTKAAEEGDSEAQTKLGLLYYSQSDKNKTCLGHDYKQAFDWFMKAGNNPEALEAIGNIYKYGLGREKNETLAQSYFDKTIEAYVVKAAKGDSKSAYLLGQYYSDGKLHAIDYEKAIGWYTKAANKNYIPALEALGLLYSFGGENFAPDMLKAKEIYDKLISIYEEQIKEGQTSAMVALSGIYLQGFVILEDKDKARSYLLEAHNKNNLMAKEILVNLVEAGYFELPKDITLQSIKDSILELKQQEAKSGNIAIIRELGFAALNSEEKEEVFNEDNWNNVEGNIIEEKVDEVVVNYKPNYGSAIDWFNLGADKGDALSMMELGKLYAEANDDNIQSDNLAKVWLEKSAEQCYEPSYLELGKLYSKKNSALENANTANSWYIKAAMQGNIEAQYRLAKSLYTGGKGKQPNMYEALSWLYVLQNGYEKIGAQESPEYKDVLELIQKCVHYLSEEELNKAKEEAKQMIQKYGSL